MKVLFLSITCFLLTACLASAQAPTVTASPNSVFAGADGKFEAAADTAVVQFNITAQADTAKEAYDAVSKQAEQVRRHQDLPVAGRAGADADGRNFQGRRDASGHVGRHTFDNNGEGARRLDGQGVLQ